MKLALKLMVAGTLALLMAAPAAAAIESPAVTAAAATVSDT